MKKTVRNPAPAIAGDTHGEMTPISGDGYRHCKGMGNHHCMPGAPVLRSPHWAKMAGPAPSMAAPGQKILRKNTVGPPG